MRLVIRLLLCALAFTTILPMIGGIDFHGNFGAAIGLAVLFTIMLWVVELAALALAAVWTVGTLGIALLWIIPLWILGFWLLPAIALLLVADLMPAYLTVSGWLPAAIAGLVMLFIFILTGEPLYRKGTPA